MIMVPFCHANPTTAGKVDYYSCLFVVIGAIQHLFIGKTHCRSVEMQFRAAPSLITAASIKKWKDKQGSQNAGIQSQPPFLVLDCRMPNVSPNVLNITGISIYYQKDDTSKEERIGAAKMENISGTSHTNRTLSWIPSGEVLADEAFLRLEWEGKADPCSLLGRYSCYLEYTLETVPQTGCNASFSVEPTSLLLEYYDPPKPMTLSVSPSSGPYRLGLEVTLTCSGEVRSDAAEVQWQWAVISNDPDVPKKDLVFTDFVPAPYDKVSGSSVENQHALPCGNLTRATVRSTLVRTISLSDNGRRYRCYPKEQGRDPLRITAATVAIITQVPPLMFTLTPSLLHLTRGNSSLPGSARPLDIHCGEIERPLDPLLAVQISVSQLQREGWSVTRAYSLKKMCSAQSTSWPESSPRSLPTDNHLNFTWNLDFGKKENMYVGARLSNSGCKTKGKYQCKVSYTLEVPGASPVVMTQVATYHLRVATQFPVMRVSPKAHKKIREGSSAMLTCQAEIGGSLRDSSWLWVVCHPEKPADSCQAQTAEKYTATDKRSVPKFNEASCVYEQQSRLLYRFTSQDVGSTRIQCCILTNSCMDGCRATDFEILAAGAGLLYGASGINPKSTYFNCLATYVIPLTLVSGILMFGLLSLYFVFTTFLRIRARLSRTVCRRRKKNRTDHFRIRKTSFPSQDGDEIVKMNFRESMILLAQVFHCMLLDQSEFSIAEKEIRKRGGPVKGTRRSVLSKNINSSHHKPAKAPTAAKRGPRQHLRQRRRRHSGRRPNTPAPSLSASELRPCSDLREPKQPQAFGSGVLSVRSAEELTRPRVTVPCRRSRSLSPRPLQKGGGDVGGRPDII